MVAGAVKVPMLVKSRTAVFHDGRALFPHPVQSHLRLSHCVKGIQHIGEHVSRGVVTLGEDILQCRIFIRGRNTGNNCQGLHTVVRKILETRSYIGNPIPEL